MISFLNLNTKGVLKAFLLTTKAHKVHYKETQSN